MEAASDVEGQQRPDLSLSRLRKLAEETGASAEAIDKKVEHRLEEKEERGESTKTLQKQERELQDELSEIRVQRSHTLRSLSVDDSDGGEQMHMANPLSRERQGPEQGDDT